MANYNLFSNIKHLWSPLHLPFLKKGQSMRAIFAFLKRTFTSTLNLVSFSSSRTQTNSFSAQKGLVPKCLFIKTPKTTPDKKIEPMIRTMDKRVKPLRISTLRSVSSVSNINNPLGDYNNKNIKEIKKWVK